MSTTRYLRTLCDRVPVLAKDPRSKIPKIRWMQNKDPVRCGHEYELRTDDRRNVAKYEHETLF
jgi:hypothetical protein